MKTLVVSHEYITFGEKAGHYLLFYSHSFKRDHYSSCEFDEYSESSDDYDRGSAQVPRTANWSWSQSCLNLVTVPSEACCLRPPSDEEEDISGSLEMLLQPSFYWTEACVSISLQWHCLQ